MKKRDKLMLKLDLFTALLSYGNLYIPNRYKDIINEMTTQIPINISLFRSPQCSTKSALDRNLNAKPNSRKPNIILNVFIHLPDLGKDFSILGKRANKVNGRANAIPNPNIPIDN
jgi:hypothetical protein